MLTRVLGVSLAAASVVVAHGSHGMLRHRDHHPMVVARQASGSSSSSHSSTGTSTSPAPTGTNPPSGTTPSKPAVTAPGAVPLASIVASVATNPHPSQLPTTQAGAKPSGLPNAPALPDISSWNPADYPKLDTPPPTDSDEVIGWINEVRNSGVVIPDIAPTYYNKDGGSCNDAKNAAHIHNDTVAWWSCGHAVRKTDIVECKQSKVWGSSFDDGPTENTANLLHYLEAQKIKTTFFVVGSRVASRPQYLQTEYVLGHQIAVHTWSHFPLTSLTSEQVIAEFGWSKKVIKDAIGVTPQLMRPPYGDIDDRVRAIAKAMGLTPVIWTSTGSEANPIVFDTGDWEVSAGTKTAEQSVTQFLGLLDVADKYPHGFMVLEHDMFWHETQLATDYFLPTALSRGYQVTSINQCMNQNLGDTYAETNSLKSLPAGSGIGNDVTFSSIKAPKNAPLGGSDGSNTDINKPAGDGKKGDSDGGATHTELGFAAALVAGAIALVPAVL